MADMPSEFWSGWVIALTLVSLAGLIWLIISIYFLKDDNQEFVSPVWDESLKEGNYPAPMWWFWMILTALVISAVYLMLYPGLGSFSGTLKWSQSGRLDQNLIRYSYQFADARNKIAQTPIAELQKDMEVMNSARRIFSQNCAACHGADGEGQAMTFPNLMDDDWQWGNAEDEIEHTLRHGRQAVMVAWQSVLGDEGVSQVIDYVKTMSSENHSSVNDKGMALYQQFCVACHGESGEGNQALGAPRLADDIWLYGNSDSQLRHSISLGRNGVMPAFDRRLNDAQIRMLIAWLTRPDR
jgi:cytochrome c oxidase cbb3-type subunit 3